MDHRGRTWRRAVARLAIEGLAGAFLLLVAFAPGALAAPVSHFNINSVALTEGDAGTTNLTFTISYTGTKNNISVDWATANGTATAGADYVASSGTATFTIAGATSQTINIPVNGDLLDEANETFTVNLSNPTPAATADITTPTGTGTINDNDPTPSLVINDVSQTEGNVGTTNANFAVTLSAPSGRNVTVNYATANGTAVQPGDYTTTSGTLTFTPGQVAKTVPVPIVGDVTDEPNETYVVNLSGAANATIADNQGAGTIVNDDTAPSLTINDVSLTEGNAGTTNMTFTATLSAASGKIVTVAYATADGTATTPADYTASAGTLTFNPGVVTRTFTVPVVGDTRDEFDETFVANLSSPVNATIADSQGVGTIVDNDPTPSLVINNVAVTEVDAGSVTATFTATLSAASNKVVTVDYATSDVTAIAPGDYSAASGTLTFAPGVTTQTVPIAVQGDLLNEASETYRVTLSNPGNATITTAIGTGTITDNDPLPSIVINDVSQPEGNAGTTNADFTVTLSAPSGRNVTVNYATANSTAVQPGDYTTTSGTLTFTPGQVSKTVSVPVVGDVLDEIDEVFFVNLTVPTNATIADNQGVGTILDDDPPPSLTINDVSLAEGNAGTANMTFTATLSAVSSKIVTVAYATADGTATAPADYTAASGTLTFNPGVLTRTFTVPIVGDVLDEFDETFAANLSSVVNATIADNQGVGTIVDNDPTPSVGINNVTVVEVDAGSVTATFTATLSAVSGRTVTVDYATSDVTATAPADYTAASGTLTFAPGVTTRTIPIAVQGDLSDEANETYRVTLSNPTNVTIAAAIGTGTITDNDPPPSIVINDVSVAEGDAGTANMNFDVSLSVPSGLTVTVNYATANSTAVQPGDYTTTSGTLTFLPGQGTTTISVPVIGDATDEVDETFFVNLSAATNASIADAQGVGTILDDDPLPSLTINDVSLTEGDAGTATITFTATLSAASGKMVTVDYATADGTATAPGDFGVSVGTLTFNPGVVTRTFTVPVVGDTTDEFDETFLANLSNPANATIADDQGVGTIVDDDAAPTVGIDTVSTPEGDAGTSTATFTVSLSAPSGKAIGVDYATADGTATAPGDYAGVSGTLSFAPGQTAKTVDVAVQGDLLNEFDETYAVNLSNLSNVAPGILSGTGTIVDDDPMPTVSVGDVSAPEGDAGAANATFSVSLSAPSGKAVSVDYATADGTATAPGDYAGVSGTLSFAPGQTAKTVDVAVSGDTTYENDETFVFSLSNLVNVAPGAVSATDTISNDDALPQASINDRSVSEGDAGPTAATFTVSLTNPSASPISIDASTSDQTATAPGDYGTVSTTVTFAPGQVSTTVDALVQGDTVHELDETYAVDLSNPTGAALADAHGVGTIVDDDAAPVLAVGDATVTEGNAGDVTASFPVTLTGATQVPVTVDVATADGTATAPGDYAALTTSLTFSPGQTAKTVDVTVHGDTTFELDETFSLHLSNPAGATIGIDPGLGTIANDDSTPGLAVTDVSLPEGNAGDSIATFTVALGAPSAFPISVDVASADGTATQPSDYDPVATATLTFAPGETTKTVDVTIHGDTTVEPDETFTVQLANPVGASIADGVGNGTIVDDDAVPAPPSDDPTASIGDASVLEGDAGTTATLSFPVSLSKASSDPVTVVYRTSDRSATAGSDYVENVGSVRIPAGETTATVPVTVTGDDVIEPDETLALEITNVFGGTGGSAGTGTIVNDDREITHLILRAKGRHHHVVSRGRMLHAEPGMRVAVVLLRKTGNGFVPIARTTVRVHVRGRGGVRTGIFTTRFSHQRSGRYVVRAIFRGDAHYMPSHARARVRL